MIMLDDKLEYPENSFLQKGGLTADEVTYDNTTSGLTADNVQTAIDELESTRRLQDLNDVYAPVLERGTNLVYNDVEERFETDVSSNSGFTEVNGFVNDDIIVSYSETNRTVTLTGFVEGRYKGVIVPELVNGWVSEPHTDDTSHSWFLFYNDTGFHWSNDVNDWRFGQLLIDIVIRVNTDSGYRRFSIRECHGQKMSAGTHKNLHEQLGTYRQSGGAVSGIVLNSTTVADRRPIIAKSYIVDEDIVTGVASTTGNYTQVKLTGADEPLFSLNNADIINLNGDVPYWNQLVGGVWQDTPMNNNEYAKIFVYDIPVSADPESQAFRRMFVQPQLASSSLATIQGVTPASINFGTLSGAIPEIVCIHEFIIRLQGGNWRVIESNVVTGNKANQITASASQGLTSVATNEEHFGGDGRTNDPLYLLNPLPSGGKDGQPLVKSSLNTPLYRQGCFRYSASGVFWDIIDVDNMTRETPSSYVASGDNGFGFIANAFDDNIGTNWASDVEDAYVDIDFATNKTITVLGIATGALGTRKPKIIEVFDRNTDETISAYETIRNYENRDSLTFPSNILYYTIDKPTSTDKLRIRFAFDWFGVDQIRVQIIQLFSGDIVYKPVAYFGNNGFFSLISQTETTTSVISEAFRPVSNAGHSKYSVTTSNKTYAENDIDTWWNVASSTTTNQIMNNSGSLAGKALNIFSLNGSHNILPASGRRFMLNGERLNANQAYIMPRYSSCKWVKANDSDTGESLIIPDTPVFLNCSQGLKSADARKLDDYYELDANVNLAASGGTLTIGATNKIISSVKVGQNVNISGYLDVSVATDLTGTLTITGLPHTCRSGLKYDSELSISVEGVTIPADHYWSSYVINNTTTIRIRLLDLTGAVVDASQYITTDAKIRIGGVYNANS